MKRGAAHQLSYRLLHWTPIQRLFNFASQGKKVLHSKRCHRLQKSYLKLVQSFTTCTVGYESDRSAIYHQLCISSNPKPGNDEIMDQYNFCDMRHQLKFNCIARGLVQPSQHGWLGGGCPSLYRSYIPRLSYHIGCTVLTTTPNSEIQFLAAGFFLVIFRVVLIVSSSLYPYCSIIQGSSNEKASHLLGIFARFAFFCTIWWLENQPSHRENSF